MILSPVLYGERAFMVGAMRTTEYPAVFFRPMANDTTAAMAAHWSQGLNGTFEGVESMGLAFNHHVECFVVGVTAGFACCHIAFRWN
jgi:hypothetical protein